MYCPLIVNQYGNPQSCEKRYCALWDEKLNQCAIKTFLIPPKPSSQIEPNELQNLMMMDEVIQNLTNTSKRITEECEAYLGKEGRL